MIDVQAITMTATVNCVKTSSSLSRNPPMPFPWEPANADSGDIEERYNAGYRPESKSDQQAQSKHPQQERGVVLQSQGQRLAQQFIDRRQFQDHLNDGSADHHGDQGKDHGLPDKPEHQKPPWYSQDLSHPDLFCALCGAGYGKIDVIDAGEQQDKGRDSGKTVNIIEIAARKIPGDIRMQVNVRQRLQPAIPGLAYLLCRYPP